MRMSMSHRELDMIKIRRELPHEFTVMHLQ